MDRKTIEALQHALHHQDFEAGRLLAEILQHGKEDPEYYGEWETFDNFVAGVLKIKPRHAYRLVFAYGMREFLAKHDRVLPITESQVRPLSAIESQFPERNTQEAMLLKAWDNACLMRQRSTPTAADVSRAVERLVILPPDDESTNLAFRGYRTHANRIKTELATMTKRLADLAGFLQRSDKKALRQRKDMAVMLAQLTMSLHKQYLLFSGNRVPDEKLFEKGKYVAEALKADRLQLRLDLTPTSKGRESGI